MKFPKSPNQLKNKLLKCKITSYVSEKTCIQLLHLWDITIDVTNTLIDAYVRGDIKKKKRTIQFECTFLIF